MAHAQESYPRKQWSRKHVLTLDGVLIMSYLNLLDIIECFFWLYGPGYSLFQGTVCFLDLVFSSTMALKSNNEDDPSLTMPDDFVFEGADELDLEGEPSAESSFVTHKEFQDLVDNLKLLIKRKSDSDADTDGPKSKRQKSDSDETTDTVDIDAEIQNILSTSADQSQSVK